MEPIKPGRFISLIDKYIESDVLVKQIATHKRIGDNLRCYPVIVILTVAVFYIWNVQGYAVYPSWAFKAAAVIWSAWIFWFSVLTFFQTHQLFVDLAHDWMGLRLMRKPLLRTIYRVALFCASLLLMLGAVTMVFAIASLTSK